MKKKRPSLKETFAKYLKESEEEEAELSEEEQYNPEEDVYNDPPPGWQPPEADSPW